MVKTIKSSMSQARKKMLEQIKNKEESEVKRKKTTKEKYKEIELNYPSLWFKRNIKSLENQ